MGDSRVMTKKQTKKMNSLIKKLLSFFIEVRGENTKLTVNLPVTIMGDERIYSIEIKELV